MDIPLGSRWLVEAGNSMSSSLKEGVTCFLLLKRAHVIEDKDDDRVMEGDLCIPITGCFCC